MTAPGAAPAGALVREVPYRRIATEEAFATRELLDGFRKLLAGRTLDDPGFHNLWGFYLGSTSPRAVQVIERLQQLGQARIADMDECGIAQQILALTSPGVQVFDAQTAHSLAVDANDQLAEAVRKHPSRYAGLVAVAPQDPTHAAKEIERGISRLGLKGVIINSHTHHTYLDEPRFWDIFAAAEACDAPIYLHPNTPSKDLIGPLMARGLEGAVFGFGVETALHTLRIIVSGVFDRFPKLKLVLGHCGEALPFWLYRLDYMHGAMVRANRYESVKPLKKPLSDYLRHNVYVTTSGMAWEPAIMFCHNVLGADHVMYAMDYPYQVVAAEVAASDDLPLTAADKQAFFQTNAERLFKL